MTDGEIAALQALLSGDAAQAQTALVDHVHRPLLNAALRTYLAGESNGQVYDSPAAFTAFIRGGSNVGLYHAVSTALAQRYDRFAISSLADIGCGDGLAVIPALTAAKVSPAVTLVEPSQALLDAAVNALAGYPGTVTTHATDAAAFTANLSGRFDLAESTFALHTLPYEDRSAMLSALRPNVSRIALVEFDVPDHAVGSAEHLMFLADAYERGVGDYSTDRDLVAQGFLMPVLAGQLDPDTLRNTWEQPATDWAAQLTSCGYQNVMIEPLYDYWWSPAFLLTADA